MKYHGQEINEDKKECQMSLRSHYCLTGGYTAMLRYA